MQIQKASCSFVAYGEEARRKGTISQYFTTLHCPVCDELTQLGVCCRCRADPQRVVVTLHQDMRRWESQQEQMLQVKWRSWRCPDSFFCLSPVSSPSMTSKKKKNL